MPRRGEKRSRGGEKGSLGDGQLQRRRSPRLSGSTSASSRHLQNIDAHCNRQSNINNGAIAGSASGIVSGSFTLTASKKEHQHFPPSCNSNNHKQDHEKLVPDRSYCQTLDYNLLLVISCKQADGAPSNHDRLKADKSWLPEKSILELVLDTMQRRDTYDIFAEPVDPSEVEEYYVIIKEPMDFGTMRAKLHEGMYKNLQQFEHDMFLIFENAMHFNSSATVYFRQARALEELAKKVFFVLKTDPEKFKLEFTSARRRSNRKINVELSDLTIGSCQKLGRDLKSNSMCIDLVQKGCQRQRKTFETAVDRRSTYQPWMFLFDEANSTLSPIYYGFKSLTIGNQEDVGYKESLMLYVRDLGPTVHRVAKNKLQGSWKQASGSPGSNCWDSFQKKCPTHAALLSNQRESNHAHDKSCISPSV